MSDMKAQLSLSTEITVETEKHMLVIKQGWDGGHEVRVPLNEWKDLVRAIKMVVKHKLIL